MSLEKGIYEQVLNREVEKDIASLSELRATTKKMDKDSSSVLLSQYIENFIRKVLEDKSEVNDKIQIANMIIDQLATSFPEYEFDSKLIDKKGEALKEVRDERVNTNELERPKTSLIKSKLFSGEKEFRFLDELKKEIVSSDNVDMLVSFVKVSGIAMIRKELNEFANKGGKLRVVCTTYMGATDANAVK